jgi:hypothetical protein
LARSGSKINIFNPDLNPDSKCLFRIRIRTKVSVPYGSGSAALEFSIATEKKFKNFPCLAYKNDI